MTGVYNELMFNKRLHIPLIEALPGHLFPLAAERIGKIAVEPQAAVVIPFPRDEQLVLPNIELGAE